jgi:hypothetical protein
MAFDTSPRVAAAQAALYREIGVTGRAQIVAELSDGLRDLAITGVRSRHPEYDDAQVRQEVLSVFYARRGTRQ